MNYMWLWKKKYAPLFHYQEADDLYALIWSKHKWIGLLPKVLRYFHLVHYQGMSCIVDDIAEELYHVAADTCPLCYMHVNYEHCCPSCPLNEINERSCSEEYLAFIDKSDPWPMIKLLNEAIRIEKEKQCAGV
jgi:hypothetical protein